MGRQNFQKRSRVTLNRVVLVVATLVSFCVTPSLSQPLFYTRRGGFLGKKWLLFTSSGTPVSYRSQRVVVTSADAHDDTNDNDDDWPDSRDNNYRPWNVDFTPQSPGHYSWTSKIVMTNIVCYALQVFFPSITNKGIKLSDRILRGNELYRLVTPMFLHGGITHLLTNVYSLQAVGNDVERYFGPGRYLATYLISGIVANYVSAVKTPNPSLGASGAVFGIVGAYYVFLNRNMHVFGRQGEYMAGAITRTIMMNVFLGAMSPMVDNWSHLGGALGGAAIAYLFGPRLMVKETTPNGGGRALTIVDNPILRLPRSLEAIPEKIGDRFRFMRRRMQIESFKSELPEKPWRRKTRQNFRRRQNVPNKSVRPSF